jgi:hypothetical protein
MVRCDHKGSLARVDRPCVDSTPGGGGRGLEYRGATTTGLLANASLCRIADQAERLYSGGTRRGRRASQLAGSRAIPSDLAGHLLLPALEAGATRHGRVNPNPMQGGTTTSKRRAWRAPVIPMASCQIGRSDRSWARRARRRQCQGHLADAESWNPSLSGRCRGR